MITLFIIFKWTALGVLLLACFLNYLDRHEDALAEEARRRSRGYVNVNRTSSPMLSVFFNHLGATLPKLNYLLSEYKITEREALAAVIKDHMPTVFDRNDTRQYIDWILLKKYLIDYEVSWYKLTTKGIDIDANELEITFKKTLNGSIEAIYKNGSPVTLPAYVLASLTDNPFWKSDYRSDAGETPDQIARSIAAARNHLRKEMQKVLH